MEQTIKVDFENFTEFKDRLNELRLEGYIFRGVYNPSFKLIPTIGRPKASEAPKSNTIFNDNPWKWERNIFKNLKRWPHHF